MPNSPNAGAVISYINFCRRLRRDPAAARQFAGGYKGGLAFAAQETGYDLATFRAMVELELGPVRRKDGTLA